MLSGNAARDEEKGKIVTAPPGVRKNLQKCIKYKFYPQIKQHMEERI